MEVAYGHDEEMKMQLLIDSANFHVEQIIAHTHRLSLPSSTCCKEWEPDFSSESRLNKISDILNSNKVFTDISHKVRQILLQDKGTYRDCSSREKLRTMQESVEAFNCQQNVIMETIRTWQDGASKSLEELLQRMREDLNDDDGEDAHRSPSSSIKTST